MAERCIDLGNAGAQPGFRFGARQAARFGVGVMTGVVVGLLCVMVLTAI